MKGGEPGKGRGKKKKYTAIRARSQRKKKPHFDRAKKKGGEPVKGKKKKSMSSPKLGKREKDEL